VFVFVMCGVFRLARFNVQRHSGDGRYFVGLPIPMAAAQVAALVHFDPEPITLKAQAVMMVGLLVTLALLMVSTMRYHSFKGLDLRKRRSYITVVGFLMLLLPIVAFPEFALLLLASAYAISRPTNHLWPILRRRGAAPPGALAAGEAR